MAKGKKTVFSKDQIRQIKELGRIHCTLEETAAVMGCSKDVLRNDEYRVVWQEARLEGRASLRRIQFKQAETNPHMAIFLGKVILRQKEATNDSHDETASAIMSWFKEQQEKNEKGEEG